MIINHCSTHLFGFYMEKTMFSGFILFLHLFSSQVINIHTNHILFILFYVLFHKLIYSFNFTWSSYWATSRYKVSHWAFSPFFRLLFVICWFVFYLSNYANHYSYLMIHYNYFVIFSHVFCTYNYISNLTHFLVQPHSFCFYKCIFNTWKWII